MAELGETDDPKALVPGDYSALQTAMTALRSYGDVLHEAGAGLKRVDTRAGWEGKAADQFRDAFHGQPTKWLEGGDAFHTASSAVDDYSWTLNWAQGQAADAVRQWDHAQAATKKAKGEHTKQPPGTPFNDPGEAGRKAAQETLDRARHQLDSAGDTAAAKVDKAKEKAPPEPGFWSQVGSGIEHAVDEVGQALENAGKEFVNGVASFGNAAVQHPGQLLALAGGAGLTALSAGGEIGGGLLDASIVGAPAGLALNGASTAGIAAGIGIAGTATGALAMEAAGPDHVQVFNTDGGGGEAIPGEDPPFEPPKEVNGYRAHARERVFENSRGDGGVNDDAIDDAVSNPTREPKFIADKYGGSYRYVGNDAVVNLNKDGEVTTAWSRNSAGRRFPK